MEDHLTTNTPDESKSFNLDGTADNFKHLIDLLEFEINHIRSEESKPGWTTWALIASFASLLWLLTQELEHYRVDHLTALLLFLLITLIYESLFHLSRALFAAIPFRAGRFFTPRSELSKSRASMLAIIFRNCLLLVIAYRAHTLVNQTSRIFIFLFFGFDSLITIVGLFVSFVNLPLPERPRAPMGLLRAIILLPAMLGTIAGISAISRTNFTVAEFRIGALLFGLSTVFLLLLKSQPKTPLLETLIEIRRNLALGQVDIDAARRSTEIALQGMKVSDALQSKLVNLLADLERGGFHLEGAAKEFQAFAESFREQRSMSSKDTQTMILLVRQSFDRHMQELKMALDSFNTKLVKFQRRLLLYERLSPESKESLILLRARLDEAFRAFTSKRAMMIERAKQFDQTVKQKLSDSQMVDSK